MIYEGQLPQRSDCKFPRATVASRREREVNSRGTPSLGGSIRETKTSTPARSAAIQLTHPTRCVSRCHRFGRHSPPIETTISPSQERIFHFISRKATRRRVITYQVTSSPAVAVGPRVFWGTVKLSRIHVLSIHGTIEDYPSCHRSVSLLRCTSMLYTIGMVIQIC